MNQIIAAKLPNGRLLLLKNQRAISSVVLVDSIRTHSHDSKDEDPNLPPIPSLPWYIRKSYSIDNVEINVAILIHMITK